MNLVHTANKRVLLKFGLNRLYLQATDEQPNEHEYKNVLYLNNSITNENFFCLAYAPPAVAGDGAKKRLVNGLILYSDDVELIDDVIREYAVNVSSELNVLETTMCSGKNESASTERGSSPEKFEQHTCMLCPMQQFVELCDYLKVEIYLAQY